MKYKNYETHGIHSRLKVLIAKSGGYNVDLSARLLMKEYQINNYDIAYEMAQNEKIRDEIEAVGIDAVVELTKKSIRIQKIKFAGLLNSFEKMKCKNFYK